MLNLGGGSNNATTGLGGSTFGAAKPATGGFSFGSNNNAASTTGTGLFGSNTQQQANSNTGGLFGSKPAGTATGGGLFGQQNSTAPASSTTGGLFGQPSNTNATSGGLFGQQSNTNAPSGGLFGAKPSGLTTTTQTSGGLFGNQPAAHTTGGGLFGQQNNATTAPSTGGLFGTTQAGTTSTGLFGQQQQQQQPATGGLFGSKPATGGLFGQSISQPQQTNVPATATNSITSTQPSFAWSSQQASVSQQPQVPSALSNLNVQANNTQPILAMQQQQNANYPNQIQEQITKCKESWDPSSYKSKLRTYVYNKVNETEAILYNKPNNAIQEEWDHAIENKPNNQVIPVQIFGFEDLNQRNRLQIENVAQIRLILKEMLDRNTSLQQRHELETASRILKVDSKNIEIERRILKVASQLAILKNRGLPLTIGEEKMWGQFKHLLDKSNDPAGLGKSNELWARLAVLKERAKSLSDKLDNTMLVINENGGNEIKQKRDSTDDTSEIKIDKIAHILSNQQRGISYLNDILEKDNASIDERLKKK
ncbi:hypothetical protein KAFR_0A05290 [Kazachstania africana CBS 2517]|uniref:Nucleoporin Nup54 alpha-helical domain-containing protein n=1 Tax=Kazachstania africana (strain ATCC 22294 / BCRC 22015 / CBS 2517 / CECT 1963 / NBRC 1671 / NRRL Y-8276) TaxID=1071382 RepID=H2ANL4_KAZAF|nr:hypothetical protein KAFR_0A05290 [Kazachstania africana CBS 2517]CCF55964.1 hypothetical protein KAFR_0A05290 [Kazachstania africana CBS 2517]